jgi:hypothetical protein
MDCCQQSNCCPRQPNGLNNDNSGIWNKQLDGGGLLATAFEAVFNDILIWANFRFGQQSFFALLPSPLSG